MKQKMYMKVCLVLAVICECTGQIYPRENVLIPPPQSLARIYHNREPWQIAQRNKPVISVPHYISRGASIINRSGRQPAEIRYAESDKAVNSDVPPAIQNVHLKESSERSSKRQTLDFRVTKNHTSIMLESTDTEILHFQSPESNRNISGSSEEEQILRPEILETLESRRTNMKTNLRNRTSSFRRRRFHRLRMFPDKDSDAKGVLPDDVCDRCPVNSEGKSTLTPCTCVGNTGSSAGLISITCPSTIHNLEELKGILTGTEYFTNRVSRFTLENSTADGTITNALWGELNFVQVLLDNNRLNYVDNKAFINSADTLHLLSLKNNSIEQYVTGTKNDLPYLQTLDLSYNKLPIIFSEAFSYKALKYLDLSYNEIVSLGKDSFAELDNITDLNLSHNQLTKLDDEAFKFNSHVVSTDFFVIDLSNNQISTISDTAFAGLNYVQISLENNQLTLVREAAFRHILVDSDYYAEILLMGNPIVCDCDIYWIANDTMVNSCFDNFLCTNLGMYIDDIKLEDLGNCTEAANSSQGTLQHSLQYSVPLG